MFSGIIHHQGKVVALETSSNETSSKPETSSKVDWRITIETDLEASRCKPGASIACNGICLTVAQLLPSPNNKQHDKQHFVVQAGLTTRERTTLSEWSVGRSVNLESALCLGDPLDGHLVMGHVDACVSVARRIERENEIGLDFLFPASTSSPAASPASITEQVDLRACCAPRGSVALDGVSLTVSACEDAFFSVAVIPYTAEHTTLGSLNEGERVNLEVDVLARYVSRRLSVAGVNVVGVER